MNGRELKKKFSMLPNFLRLDGVSLMSIALSLNKNVFRDIYRARHGTGARRSVESEH